MLEIINIFKSIKGKIIISDLSLNVNYGEIFGLLGPNGAGKTSTFYIIAGLVNADNGKVILENKDITTMPMHLRSNLGLKYLPQEPSIFLNLTVKDNLYGLAELSFKNKGDIKKFIDASIEEFDLSDILNLKGRQLSGGQRRKVEIARTLASKPKIILLDEPFAGIDPIAIEDIKNVLTKLSKKNIGILITDHNVRETLNIVDKVYIVNEGAVFFEGVPEDAVNNEKIKKFYLGSDFKL